ncbi:MAG: DNA mismatch repair endonuclease MutL [Fimbriimonadaceae bacterium]|nr:DNA mismatch repair endonuclease MutL [Fimbriimonadaceae bacterium]
MTTLGTKVRLLDAHTVNQIAAGEVVERPASVVKELVENALDAGARRIEVDLESAGRRLIRVADDGVGMSLADAQTALQRHATSKIERVEDLGAVTTLGFRGEALPSIASVSRMTLSTGETDGLRHVLVIDGGKVEAVTGAAGPRGTTVTIEDLFFNTPARLKFLKTDGTELATCVEALSKYVLANPDVAFSLRHGGSVLLSSTGSGDLLTTISEVWGRDLARTLAEIDGFSNGLRVRGFVSPPHVTKPTRAYQWIYVNGRPIKSRSLGAAIDQAYRSLTPERRFPLAALMLDIDPARVDMNVSPTKSEVKFQHEGQAFDGVRHAIKAALMAHGMVPSAADVAKANEALSGYAAVPGMQAAEQVPLFDAAAPLLGAWLIHGGLQGVQSHENGSGPGHPPPATGHPLPDSFPDSGYSPPDSPSFPAPRHPLPDSEPGFQGGDLLDGLRILGQLFSTFIIAENRRGLLIIDQHVAHERILYEMLRNTRGASPIEKQSLLAPETLHLDRRSAELLLEQMDEVRALGFDIDPFGGESFLVRSAPAALKGKNPVKVLRDFVEELVEGTGAGRVAPTRDAILIMCSCKMAIKAGDPMSHAEMEKLIVDLAATENPYLCPHGRPITIVLSRGDLLRKFKRA